MIERIFLTHEAADFRLLTDYAGATGSEIRVSQSAKSG
jgi:hypothetical protein